MPTRDGNSCTAPFNSARCATSSARGTNQSAQKPAPWDRPPQTPWSIDQVEVTDRRTKVDWVRQITQLVDADYPDKDRIVLVMDDLNTHYPASRYAAFTPAEARRIAERLTIHYTSKHGSWLNMAEIEMRALTGQCLDQHIPDQEALRREVADWQTNAIVTWCVWTGALPLRMRAAG